MLCAVRLQSTKAIKGENVITKEHAEASKLACAMAGKTLPYLPSYRLSNNRRRLTCATVRLIHPTPMNPAEIEPSTSLEQNILSAPGRGPSLPPPSENLYMHSIKGCKCVPNSHPSQIGRCSLMFNHPSQFIIQRSAHITSHRPHQHTQNEVFQLKHCCGTAWQQRQQLSGAAGADVGCNMAVPCRPFA